MSKLRDALKALVACHNGKWEGELVTFPPETLSRRALNRKVNQWGSAWGQAKQALKAPSEMQQLVEWLEEQGTIESKEELRARAEGQNELRVYASSRVDAYNQVLDYIRTEFLGGEK